MSIEKRTGLDINQLTIGTGPDFGIMIHCTLSNAGSLSRFANGFSDRMTLTGFDLPGHGKSQDWDFDQDYQDGNLAITETFISEPVHLVGHSFGATVALRFAHKHPHLVKSLVLFEPVFFQAALTHNPSLADSYFAAHAPFVDALDAGDNAKAAEMFLADWGDGTPWDALPDAFRETAIKRMPLVGAGAKSVHQDHAGMLNDDGLNRVNVPTLFIRGERTHFMIKHIHEALCEMMPNARDHVIANAGHMVPITHAKDCIDVVTEFYDRL